MRGPDEMTPTQQKQAESDAESDAKKLALLLLLLFRRRTTPAGRQISFDAATMKFRVDGRAVSVASTRMYLQRIQDSSAKKLAMITLQLEKGEITLAAWQREFERTITTGHILAGALVLGSIDAAVRHAGIQVRIAEQLNFADEFVEAVRTKKAGTFARIKARARSYVRAFHITFANIELQTRIAIGVDTMARRRLTAAEHCTDTKETPGCLELALKSWIAIEEMVPIGQATCGRFCRCFIEYR